MIELLKRLHTFVGLFNLTALVVFAVTGIDATFPTTRTESHSRVVPYEAPAALSDSQMAEHAVRTLGLSVGERASYPTRRNEGNHVVFQVATLNGPMTVTILESEKQARLDLSKSSLGRFTNDAHAVRWILSPPATLVRLWSLYMFCSTVSLMFMAITGSWLWLASRRHLRWARGAFGAGAVIFAALWYFVR